MNTATTTAPRTPFVLEYTFIVFLIALVVSLALYGISVNDPALFDDYFFTYVYSHPAEYHFGLHPRAIDEGTILLIKHFISEGLTPQRFANIIFHAINVALIFNLCRLLLAWVVPESEEQTKKLALTAFMAATIFLAHPAAAYSVVYLNQRSTELSTMGMLLMLMTFWKGLRSNDWTYLVLSALLYLLSLLGKEHDIMAPTLCGCLAVMHDGGLKLRRLKSLVPFILACVLIAWYVVLHSEGDLILGKAPEYTSKIMLENYSHLSSGFNPAHMMQYSVQTQATLFFNYWRMWLVPNPATMAVDIRVGFATSTLSIYTLGAVAYLLYGILATALLFFGKTRGQRFLAFSLLAPWLLFWTEFTSLRLQEIFVLYRSYLWFAPVVPLLALLFYSLSARMSAILWPLLFVVFVFASFDRVQTFKTEIALWQDAADLASKITEKRPGIERIYYNLGTAQFNAGLYPQAEENLRYAYNYVPDSELKAKIMFNLALTYKRIENFPEAIKIYRPLVNKIDPGNDSAWWLYGVSLEKSGEMGEALKAYRRACNLRNTYACERLQPGGHL